jgi:hypothetical protein
MLCSAGVGWRGVEMGARARVLSLIQGGREPICACCLVYVRGWWFCRGSVSQRACVCFRPVPQASFFLCVDVAFGCGSPFTATAAAKARSGKVVVATAVRLALHLLTLVDDDPAWPTEAYRIKCVRTTLHSAPRACVCVCFRLCVSVCFVSARTTRRPGRARF